MSLDDGKHLMLDLGHGQGIHFMASEGEPRVTYQLSSVDADALLKQIEQATHRSDVTVASLHVHTGANGRINDQSVPEFLEVVAHKCINAGADVVMCHGPHVLRGIEIFNDAPIFYSLGDFAMQHQTIEEFPAEMYTIHDTDPDTMPGTFVKMLEEDSGFPATMAPKSKLGKSILPLCTFDDGLTVKLYPLDLGKDKPVYQRGSPQLADKELAINILDDLERLSTMYGTSIERSDGIGTIRITG
ncbi:capsule synthesis protein CapA [Haloarcula argentinensis DSM 12282]|nr:capsule synthesis protein CapA [Haloarcula argentinensis DSM 12282]